MANQIVISCKSYFKNSDVNDLRKTFTLKWIELIRQKNKEVKPVP